MCARRKPVPFQERPGGVQHQLETGRSLLEATLLQEGGQLNFFERVLLLRVVQSFVVTIITRQCMTELRVTTLDDVNAVLLSSFYCPLQESKSGMEMPKVSVVSRYFVAYLTFFVDVAPFFRAKDDYVQTGTVKFFDKLGWHERYSAQCLPASQGNCLVQAVSCHP